MASNSIKRDHHLWTRDTIKNVSGDVTLDIDGDLELNADGGTVTIKDDSASHFLFDLDNTRLRIYDDANANHYLTIAVDTGGVTSIATVGGIGGAAHLTVVANGNLTLDSDGDIALSADGGNITMDDATATIFDFNVDTPTLKIMDDAQVANYCSIAVGANGATTLTTVDADAAVAHLNLVVDGAVDIGTVGDIVLDAGGYINLDAGEGSGTTQFQDAGTTYGTMSAHHGASHLLLFENEGASTDDYMRISAFANGETDIKTEDGGGANAHLNFSIDGHINLNYNKEDDEAVPCATGFMQVTASFDATDTDVNFKSGNKQILTLTADIVDVHFQFPAVSGNFLCVFLQDGTGGWDVTNWKTKDAAGNAGAGNSGVVKWAGGSATSLTETADKADIISIYWDATNEMAYAVASENF